MDFNLCIAPPHEIGRLLHSDMVQGQLNTSNQTEQQAFNYRQSRKQNIRHQTPDAILVFTTD